MKKKFIASLCVCAILALAFVAGVKYANREYITKAKTSYMLTRQTMLLRQAEQAAPVDTVIIGDSIVDGMYLGKAGGNIFLAGIGGSGVGDWLTFAPKLAQVLDAKLLIIALGVNDAVKGLVDTKHFYADYSKLCLSLREQGTKLALASILPVEQGKIFGDEIFDSKAIREFNLIIEELALENGFDFINFFTVFADADGLMPHGLTTDGVHLTKKAYTRWKQVFSDYLSR